MIIEKICRRVELMNPWVQWVIAVVVISGLSLAVIAATMLLWELPTWLPAEISEHPVRAALGLIISAWILIAVWVTFRRGPK
jgi:hypothetical protein